MTTAQVVETSVTVNNNSPIQDYIHPDDQTQPFEMTPGFKPFTKKKNKNTSGILNLASSQHKWLLKLQLKKLPLPALVKPRWVFWMEQ